MFTELQKNVQENLQEKLYCWLLQSLPFLTKPEFNNVCSLCLGILKSKSVIINRIAQKLNEAISLKKTCDRFYHNLQRKNLAKKIQEAILSNQCKGLDSNTAIIVDDSDIIKSKATKMEGLKKVRDGSTGRVDQNGYDLINIVACHPEKEGYQIKPLSSDLYSSGIEQDSIIQVTQERMEEIILHSNNQGVFVMDRGYDNRSMFSFFQDNGCDYIVRSEGKRNLIVNGVEKNFMEVAKAVDLKFTIKVKGKNKTFQSGIKRVKIRLDPYPKKEPETTDAWLILSRYVVPKGKKGGFFYFLCDFPNQNLTEKQIVEKVLNMYPLRWKIEEVHRHIKQYYGWEQIQLMTYTALQNMNQILLLAMCYLYSLREIIDKLAAAFPNILIYSKKLWKDIYYFVYYRITNVVSDCFSYVTRDDINKYKWKCVESQRLILPCFKNGGI